MKKITQKTNRVIIHGNASNTTTLYFKSQLGNDGVQKNTSALLNTCGFSLIQASDKAKENSFKLAKNYNTVKSLPYKYTLMTYGPTSSHESISQY
ncbi:hypothetical protein [Bartonella koehlerae]|uniref:hypothetical protein n=1 Tax=Bartonella koehlerae TaxID=92181 RepID=UPI00068B093F|nr:hypothetical protein [Bartonella koehlerae]